jgi:hypothetical protein
MKSALFAAAAALSTALVVPAQAEQVKVGQLQCIVSAGLGMIIASSKEMECRFTTANGRHHEMYHGRINKFGLDIGGTDRGTLTWGVFASTKGPLRDALAGDYAGLGANATLGVGLGANSMVGGSTREFSLQPISVQTQTGLNIAAGVSSMTLRPGA